jgi:lipase chaperone LimK
VRHQRAAVAVAATLAIGLLIAWLALPERGASPLAAREAVPAQRMNGFPTADQLVAAIGQPPSRAGKEAGADEFLTRDLRFRVEDLLLEAGEADTPAALKARLAALVSRHFSARDAVRALALAERYVDYRVGLGAIKPPADPGDPRALRSALEARQRIRAKHFSADEYAALFGQEEELDRFTLARLEIERNDALTAAQKAAALRDAERELSEAQRALRAEAMAQVAVAAQTAAFDAARATDHERYAQRRAQYGDAAAAQLAQLDREEKDWQSRLDAYAAGKAANAGADQLQRLREQLFSREEQLRIDAALALRQIPAPTQARR